MNTSTAAFAGHVRAMADAAVNRYHYRFNSGIYSRAALGRSVGYANRLIDEALALCGHPHYKLMRTTWDSKAIDFLRLFVD